jgi:hypothetical protein
MQLLGVSCAVRPIYGSLGAKGLISNLHVLRSTMYGCSPIDIKFLKIILLKLIRKSEQIA